MLAAALTFPAFGAASSSSDASSSSSSLSAPRLPLADFRRALSSSSSSSESPLRAPRLPPCALALALPLAKAFAAAAPDPAAAAGGPPAPAFPLAFPFALPAGLPSLAEAAGAAAAIADPERAPSRHALSVSRISSSWATANASFLYAFGISGLAFNSIRAWHSFLCPLNAAMAMGVHPLASRQLTSMPKSWIRATAISRRPCCAATCRTLLPRSSRDVGICLWSSMSLSSNSNISLSPASAYSINLSVFFRFTKAKRSSSLRTFFSSSMSSAFCRSSFNLSVVSTFQDVSGWRDSSLLAMSKGVSPCRSLRRGSAPRSSNSCTTSLWPWKAARCSAVRPSLPWALGSHPMGARQSKM
mmetsp:Transcript_24331/g.69400  ORF Transcript_24331/g.69400 Transcript_24331/m.69400 type:complete len:358 (+) Transcript_24331:713-1786(+)